MVPRVLNLSLVVLRVRWFRLSKLLFRVLCWYWSFAFGAGFGHSVRAVVSFHLFLWSAPCVGRPRRNSAKKCEVRVVSTSCLNSAPRIPAVTSGLAGRRPIIHRFGGRNGRSTSIRAPLKRGLVTGSLSLSWGTPGRVVRISIIRFIFQIYNV